MATAWQVILREVAQTLNSFESGTAADVQTNYLTSPLTVTQVVDPYFTLSFIKDKCIDAHGRLALEIANVRAHPWRAHIGNSETDSLASGDLLPTLAANGKTIVGAWGQVRRSIELFSEAAPERVTAYLLNPSLYNRPYDYYIDGNKIFHTASSAVTIDCCTYERSDVAAAVAANGNISLPDVLVDAIVAGAVSSCIIEAKGMEQGGYFSGLFMKAIESIRQGQTTMPMRTLPATA